MGKQTDRQTERQRERESEGWKGKIGREAGEGGTREMERGRAREGERETG